VSWTRRSSSCRVRGGLKGSLRRSFAVFQSLSISAMEPTRPRAPNRWATNGIGRDVETACGLVLSPAEQALHAQNPEPLLGGVVRAMVSVNFLNVLDEDRGDFSIGVQEGLMELGVGDGILEWVLLVSPLRDLGAQCEAEEAVGFEHRRERRLAKPLSVGEAPEGRSANSSEKGIVGATGSPFKGLARFGASRSTGRGYVGRARGADREELLSAEC